MSLRWTGVPLPSLVVARLDGILAALRDELDPKEYRDAWNVGRAIALSDATESAFQALKLQSGQTQPA